MMTEKTWDEFCELYFEEAKKAAETNLKKQSNKLGKISAYVDLDYVRDTAVLDAMEKTYIHYDSSRGASVKTFLKTLVRNAIVDTLEKESKAVAKQQDIDDVKTIVKSIAEEESDGSDGVEARKKLIPRLRAAMDKLKPSDQIILYYYLEDQKTYVSKSAEALKVSENFVSVRRNRIFKLLPKLMEMTRAEYMQECYKVEDAVFASNRNRSIGYISIKNESPNIIGEEMPFTFARRVNPIMPTLDTGMLAEMICNECGL